MLRGERLAAVRSLALLQSEHRTCVNCQRGRECRQRAMLERRALVEARNRMNMAGRIEAERNRLPRSLYAETARDGVATPPLRGDKRVGVVVVGGGFTGLSTALHLAQRGADVTVLEAREPGWGATGRNGGQVNPGLKHEPEEIERYFGRDLGRRMVSLSGGAPDRVFALVRELQIRCEANQGGRFAQPSRRVRPNFFAAPRQVGRTAARRSNCWSATRSPARRARTVTCAARLTDGAVRSTRLAMLAGWSTRQFGLAPPSMGVRGRSLWNG